MRSSEKRTITLYQRVARAHSKKPAPAHIPMSPDTKDRDFISVYLLSKAGDRLFVLDRVEGANWIVRPKRRPYSPYDEPQVQILAEQLPQYRLQVVYYYGDMEWRVDGAFSFLVSYYLCLFAVLHVRDRLSQALFDRQMSFRLERMEVLRFVVEDHLKSGVGPRPDEITAWMLQSRLRGTRAFRHPRALEFHDQIDFILESLMGSGELERGDGGFSVTPKAMETLSAYETEERRHRGNLRLQGLAAIAAFFLAATAALQAWTAYRQFQLEALTIAVESAETLQRLKQQVIDQE